MTTVDQAPSEARGATSHEEIGLPDLVSVDDHVVEPPTLWTDRVGSHLGDKVPHVVRKKVPKDPMRWRVSGVRGDLIEGVAEEDLVWADVWVYEDVQVPLTRNFQGVGMDPDDIETVPMTLDEIRKGAIDLDARLADMDIDGVEASVCFPNNFVRFCGQRFLEADDKDLALECVRAYNDWILEDWQGRSDGRLLGSGIIPLWDPELAAAEVRRIADKGCTSVCFSEIPARLGLPSMYSGYWEPFFTACAETDTVINLHIGSSSTSHTTSDDAPLGVRIANHFSNSAFSLSDWLLCGAFIRHPNLKVAFSEGQAGWIPYVVHRLDSMWTPKGDFRNRTPTPEPPSSYLAEHVYACIFDDRDVLRHLDVVGEDNICFEVDYPHPDGSWPNSKQNALTQTRDLDPDLQKKILRLNGARLYRIDRILDRA